MLAYDIMGSILCNFDGTYISDIFCELLSLEFSTADRLPQLSTKPSSFFITSMKVLCSFFFLRGKPDTKN